MTNVFAIVRVSVPHEIHNPKTGTTIFVDPNRFWNYVLGNYGAWKSDKVKLLYMTHRHLQEDISLIFETENLNILSDFLTKYVAPNECVRGMWLINLTKMKFFKIPSDFPEGFSRYTLTIDVKPNRLKQVFETISSFRFGRDIMINYIAQTFHSFHSSLMVSVLAKSRNHLDAFVRGCIEKMDGVMEVETTHISKTMRLVPAEEWKETISGYMIDPCGEQIEDIEAPDDSFMAGC